MAGAFVQNVVIVVPRATAGLTLNDFLYVMPLFEVFILLVKHNYLIAKRYGAFNLSELARIQMFLIIMQVDVRFLTIRLVNAHELCVDNFMIEFVAGFMKTIHIVGLIAFSTLFLFELTTSPTRLITGDT